MNELEQIRKNLEKIRKLNEQIHQMDTSNERQKCDQGNQVINQEEIEYQLLLEELEQQKEITRRLRKENRMIKKKKKTLEMKYEQLINQNSDSIQKCIKEMEANQSKEDRIFAKEEKRLRNSIKLLEERNKELLEKKQLLSTELNLIEVSTLPKKSNKHVF